MAGQEQEPAWLSPSPGSAVDVLPCRALRCLVLTCPALSSSLLFVIFMEMLLRYLRAGDRDYRIKCLQGKTTGLQHPPSDTVLPQQQTRNIGNAFADDLALTTSTREDMCKQIQKLEVFCKTTGIRMNVAKCNVTARVHTGGEALLTGQPLKDHLKTIKAEGVTIPPLDPDQPYKYLGVHLTLTLNWKCQYQACMSLLTKKLPKLIACQATPLQKVKIMQTCVLPATTYGIGIAPYTPEQIKEIDGKIMSAYKKILGFPRGSPNAIMNLPTELLGLNVPSLMAEYAAVNTVTLVEALNDDGLLGLTTRELLASQGQHLYDLPLAAAWTLTTQNTSMRQMRLLEIGDMEIRWSEDPTKPAINPRGQTHGLVDLINTCAPAALSDKHVALHKRLTAALVELGIKGVSCLMHNGSMLSLDEFKRKFQPNGRQQIAYTQLVTLLCTNNVELSTVTAIRKAVQIPRQDRQVVNTTLTTEELWGDPTDPAFERLQNQPEKQQVLEGSPADPEPVPMDLPSSSANPTADPPCASSAAPRRRSSRLREDNRHNPHVSNTTQKTSKRKPPKTTVTKKNKKYNQHALMYLLTTTKPTSPVTLLTRRMSGLI